MITIYDNFLKQDEVRDIYSFLNTDDFIWNKIDDYRGQQVKRMSFGRTIRQPMIGEIMHDDPLVSYLHNKIKEKNIPETNNLYKVSINCIKPFEHFEYHTDEWGSTVIFYVNPVWKWYWGSGTKFRRGGIVRPKPGRAVVFNGRIQHKIIPPTPLMNDFGRLSIAFQYNP
jgi:hypothetical protein